MSNTVINTNVLSINAQRNLSKSAGMFAQSLERLSSGLRINSAKDDAAGLAIATRFSAQINGSLQAMRNTNDGLSITQTAEGSMNTIMDNLQTMRQLAVQSSSDGNNALDRQALNNDLQALLSEVKRIAATTEFNGTRLLDGTTFGQVFQIGANQGQTIQMNGVDVRSTQIGASRVVGSQGLSADDMKAGFEVNGKVGVTLSQSRGVALAENLVLDIDLDKLEGFNDAAKYNSIEVTKLSTAAVQSIGNAAEDWGGIDLTLNGQKFDVEQAFADSAALGGPANWGAIQSGEDLATFLNHAVATNPAYGIQEDHPTFATWEDLGGGMGKLSLQTDASVSMVGGNYGTLLNTTGPSLEAVYTSDQLTVSPIQTTTTGTSSATATVSVIDVSGLTLNAAQDVEISYDVADGSNTTFTIAGGVHGADWDQLVSEFNADTAQNSNGRFELAYSAGNLTITDNWGRGVLDTTAVDDDGGTGTSTGAGDITITETEATINNFGPSTTFAEGTYHWLQATVGGEAVKVDISAETDLAGIETAFKAAFTTADDTGLSLSLNASTGVLTIGDTNGQAISNVSFTNPHAATNANSVSIKLSEDEIGSITHIGMLVAGAGHTDTTEDVTKALENVTTGAQLASFLQNDITFELGGNKLTIEANWDANTSTLTISAFDATVGSDNQYQRITGTLFQRGSDVGNETATQAGSQVNTLEDLTRVVNSAIEAAVKGTEPEGVGLKTASGAAVTNEQRQEFGLANMRAGIVTLQDGSSTITITGGFDAKFDLDVTDFRATVNNQAQTEVHFFGAGTNNILSSQQVSLNEINVATREDASLAISVIDGALAMVSDKRSEVGAVQRKFESALENLGIARQNMEASRSRIVDTDFAVETANLTKAQILQQAGISVLAQANASSQSVLSLLQ